MTRGRTGPDPFDGEVPGAWVADAACGGLPTPMFFPPEKERPRGRNARRRREAHDRAAYAAGKAVCDRCPVRAECAAHAVAADEKWGLWGGLRPDQRQHQGATT